MYYIMRSKGTGSLGRQAAGTHQITWGDRN